MRRNPPIIVLLIGISLSGAPAMGQGSVTNEQLSCESILNGLAEKQEESLLDFLSLLRGKLDKSHLSDEHIDLIITRLREIQETDPYKKEMPGKGLKAPAFVNRHAAHQCIFRFQFQKIANGVRKLPMEERVAKIVDGIENPPKLDFETTSAFVDELVLAGRDAVPFIIRHKPARAYHRRALVRALAAIGDPAGVDYLISVLRTEDAHGDCRAEAAKALAKFQGPKVVRALIEALRDQTFREVDRRQPQRPSPEHKPYIGRYYHVQHAAAQSLASITGHDWGLLFNEDHKTWSEWFNSENRETFNPRNVERTDEELRELIRSLYHRYMSGRPNPWQLSQNVLATREGIRSISEDLGELGESVTRMLRAECEARIEATPLWEDELREWTGKLVLHSCATKP